MYFEDEMGAAEAIRLHESKILLNENCWETLANGSKNPNKETVAYLHKKWRKNNFGCVNNPLEKLKEKTQSYAEKGKIFVDAIGKLNYFKILVLTSSIN